MVKYLFVTAFLGIVWVNLGAQNSPVVAIHSFEDTSCGAWVTSSTNASTRAQYEFWFRGFVSGYNFGNATNQVALGRMPEGATWALYVDKYCRENPLRPFVSAAFDLVRELRDHKE